MGVPDTTKKYPLLDRPSDGPVVMTADRSISRDEFLRDVTWWANVLPAGPHAINICRDRYRFMVTFFAAGMRGICTLLPPGQQSGYVEEIRALYPDACVLFDGDDSGLQGRTLRITDAVPPPGTPACVPDLDGDQLAAVVFTSGSTGTSKPISKPWRTLYEGAYINRRNFFAGGAAAGTLFATVPPWHMYGLEWSLMLPMVSNFAVYSGETFFPDDIRVSLSGISSRRILISTPLHLRALVRSGLEFPELDGVLCATAPLSLELAEEIEDCFATKLLEIYGCSEIGSMATRWPLSHEEWRFFPELRINQEAESVFVSAEHIPEGVELADALEFNADGSFSLEGRRGDQIKVGGKRASLGELNNRLLSIEGVIDGVFFESKPMGLEDSRRLSALAVTDGRTAEEIRKALANLIDPIFLPRPLRVVESLPRMDTGKIVLDDLRELANETVGKS